MLDIGKCQWHRGDVVSYDEKTGIHTIHAPSWNVNQDHMYRVHMSINFVSISIVPPVNGVVPIRPLWRPLVMPPLQQAPQVQAEQGAPQVHEMQGEHEMQAEQAPPQEQQGAPQVQQGAPQVQQGEDEMQAEQAPPQEQQGAPQEDEMQALVELLRRMPKLPDIDMFIESGRKRNHAAVPSILPARQILQPGMTDRNKTFVIAEGLTTIMAAMKLSLVRQGC